MEMIFAGVAFVGLFSAWVIVPSILRKRHQVNEDITNEER